MKEKNITEFYSIRQIKSGKWIVWDRVNKKIAKNNEYPNPDVAKIVAESLTHIC